MIPPDAGVDLRALVVGRARLADVRMREHAVTAVQPAVGAPDERVERFVRVLIRPAVEQHLRRAVRFVVAVFVGNEQQLGRRADPHAAETDFEPADQVELFGEHGPFVELSVAVDVFENEDPVAGLRLPGP